MIREPKNQNDFNTLIKVAANCFYGNFFYKNLTKSKLIFLFKRNFTAIKKYSKIYLYLINNKVVGFSLWFNYNELKKNEKLFNMIFPNIKHINDEVKILDSLINCNEKCLMLLAIGVKNNFRRNGIASKLIKKAKENNVNLIADVSEKRSINAYLKNGFLIARETDLIIYLKYVI